SILPKNNLTCSVRRWLLMSMRANVKGRVFIDRKFDAIYLENITLGHDVSLGHYNRLWAFDKIVIEDNVQTAIGLTIVAGSHDKESFQPLSGQQVTIGKGCWIGANVTILGNVKIGKGVIIGAGSIVNKSIPDFSIAVGNPAKVIGKRSQRNNIIGAFGNYNV
ncbi:acyltransferase, partial [Vibrio parahaemolyticus]|nr:acyltransferase [Vibrio parahaemolyticus]